MSSVVYQEVSNDFTDLNQSINSRPIMSVVYGPQRAPDSAIKPDRFGMLYIQILEGSADKKTHAWISVNNGPEGSYIWEELFSQDDVPSTVARTDISNDFQPYDQKISGNQILSFVDGGDKTPEQSKLPADFNGQFYIAVKTLSTGVKDVSLWVAHGNQWLPWSSGGGSTDTSKLAKLDVKNEFEALNYFKESTFLEHNTNFVGELSDARQLVGCRVKNGTSSPATDASWKPAMEGEICIFNNIGVTPNQLSIWMATSASSVGTSHWKQIYPTSGGSGGFTPTDFIDNYSEKESNIKAGIGSDGKLLLDSQLDKDKIAFVDKDNLFVPFQRIGGEGNEAFITGARNGHLAPKGFVVPVSTGEIYIRQIGGTNDYEIWLATQQADTDSWVQIYDQVFSDFVGEKLKQVDLEIERIEEGLKEVSDGVASDIAEVEKKVDDNIIAVDKRVTAVETTVSGFDAKVKKVETDIETLKSTDIDLNTRMNSLESENEVLEGRIYTAEQAINADRTELSTMISEVDNKVSLTNDKTVVLDDSIKTINSDLDSMATTLGKIDGEMSDIYPKVGTHEETLSHLAAQIKDLQVQIVEIRGLINDFHP